VTRTWFKFKLKAAALPVAATLPVAARYFKFKLPHSGLRLLQVFAKSDQWFFFRDRREQVSLTSHHMSQIIPHGASGPHTLKVASVVVQFQSPKDTVTDLLAASGAANGTASAR
jgi:hypothetical protein